MWRYLGEKMRRREFDGVMWFPAEINEDVTPEVRERYCRRWREEIEKLGGFQELIPEQEMYLRYTLGKELGIRHLRAPEPGSLEWRQEGLHWPLDEARRQHI